MLSLSDSNIDTLMWHVSRLTPLQTYLGLSQKRVTECGVGM